MLSDLTIWRRFQQEITENDIKAISEADYGFDVEEHFRAITEILSTGIYPDRLAWEPREVLCLVSWDEYWKEECESVERVFFCAVVLLGASEQPLSNSDLEGQVEKMIIAIDTAKLLGQGRIENLYEFFRFLVPRVDPKKVEEDFLYFKLSLFILASMLNRPANEQAELVAEVLNAERAVAELAQENLNPDIFAYTFFDQRIAIWRKYYAEYAALLEERREKEFGGIWGASFG